MHIDIPVEFNQIIISDLRFIILLTNIGVTYSGTTIYRRKADFDSSSFSSRTMDRLSVW